MQRLKRIVIVMGLTILMISGIICNEEVKASEKSNTEEIVEIYKKDFDTGVEEIVDIRISSSAEVLNGDALNSTGASSRKIIGSDDRVRIPDMLMNNAPYSCVGVVRVEYYGGKVSWGTGFLFGPNDVVTAGHILYDQKTKSIAKKISFIPQINGPYLSPTGHATYTGRNMAIPKEFMDKNDIGYDYGVFSLDTNIGDSLGYFGWTTDATVGQTVQVLGYPGDKPKYELWMAGGQLASVDNVILTHYVDMENGQSGAPIFFSVVNKIVGINVASGNGFEANIGRKVDQELANILYNTRYGDY